MQTAALAFVPQTAPARAPEALQRAEFRFASQASLERALALLRTQSWIASCSVDRTRLTLDVVLASGAARPVLRSVH